MQAMPNTKAAEAGLSYLRKHQHSNGGFGLGDGGKVNAQSTAWAVQGMIAIGADPARVESGGRSALDYLAGVQAGDGHYRYSASKDPTPIWVTGQVLAAAAGDSFPISAPPRQESPNTVSPSKTAESSPDESVETPASPLPPESHGGVDSGTSPSGGLPPRPPAAEGAVPLPEEQGGGTAQAPAGESPPPNGVRRGTLAMKSYSPGSGTPLAIGLLAAALAIGLPWWLGRRYGW
jgi:hypothetical protein